MITMDLGYLVRSGEPDVIVSIMPTVYGNIAMDSIMRGETGRMVAMPTALPLGADRRGGRDQEGRARGPLLRRRAVPAQVRRARVSPLMVLGGSA